MSSPPDDGVTILLVEDDPGDALLVRVCLNEAGVPDSAITWSRTLADALSALAAPTALPAARPGCVLLDLGLPDALGWTAVQAVVECAPDVAVIVLTGRAGRAARDGAEALRAGAQDYLVKDGVTGELLERSIRYAVGRKRAQLTQQQLREARLSSVEQARLERGLLPSPLLRTDAVACTTYYRPGRDHAVLGGDFFDVVEIADGRLRAVIGDVMGHGPDEAALGVHLRVAWRALLLAGVDDEQMLPNLARLLDSEQSGSPRYVTVCDVTITEGRAQVRLAGHPAPIVSVDGCAAYPALQVGAPLGVDAPRAGQWPATTVALPPGSSLVLYTDGLLEAYHVDRDSDSLGIDELVAAVQHQTHSGRAASVWISSLVGDAPLESVDDTAAVVLTTRSA